MEIIIKIAVAIVPLLLYVSCNAPHEDFKQQEQDYFKLKQSDVESLDLKGKVKCIKDSTFKVSLRFGEIIKTSVENGYVFEFDEQGRIFKDGPNTEHKYIEGDSTLIHERYMNGELRNYTSISYNRNGDVTKIGSYDSNGELFQLKVMTYGSDGLLKDISEFGSDGKLTDKRYDMKYDENRCLIRYKYGYSETLDYGRYTNIIYDANQNVIREETYSLSGNSSNGTKGELSETWDYGVDLESGKIVTSNHKMYYGESTVILDEFYWHIYEGDWYEKIVKDLLGFSGSASSYTQKREFIYDEHGNYVKCITYQDELPIEMIVREIEYYE